VNGASDKIILSKKNFFIEKLVPVVKLRSLVSLSTPVDETSRKVSLKLEFRVYP